MGKAGERGNAPLRSRLRLGFMRKTGRSRVIGNAPSRGASGVDECAEPRASVSGSPKRRPSCGRWEVSRDGERSLTGRLGRRRMCRAARVSKRFSQARVAMRKVGGLA